jgi:hypothetical protein
MGECSRCKRRSPTIGARIQRTTSGTDTLPSPHLTSVSQLNVEGQQPVGLKLTLLE